MIRVKEAIIVEGKYDKNTLSQILDALIICTDGFSVFNDAKKRAFICDYAERNGIIILTDSDSAGFVIRNYIKSFVNPEKIKNAFIPSMHGKEKRKHAYSAQQLLGVEGMSPEILINALRQCGAEIDENGAEDNNEIITRTDLYKMGYIGKENAKNKRTTLLKILDLPTYINTTDLLKYLNNNYTLEALWEISNQLSNDT